MPTDGYVIVMYLSDIIVDVLPRKTFGQNIFLSYSIPDGKVKAEVRILCTWKKDDAAPTLLCNLVRLSRGEMIGVKFNKDKDWVGGTIGLFEKD